MQEQWRPFANIRGYVRLVLLVDWDPVGVFGAAGAMDEYDRYVDDVCELIYAGASREELTDHLVKVEREMMRTKQPRLKLLRIADKLLKAAHFHMDLTAQHLLHQLDEPRNTL